MPQLSNSSPAHFWAQSCSSSRSCRVKSVVGKPQRQAVPARADSGYSCGDRQREGSRWHHPHRLRQTLPLPPHSSSQPRPHSAAPGGLQHPSGRLLQTPEATRASAVP